MEFHGCKGIGPVRSKCQGAFKRLSGCVQSVKVRSKCGFFSNFVIEMISGNTYLLGLAALAYVLTSVTVAAVRWFHMCRPFDQHPDFYYPGRKHVVWFSLSTLILIPFIVNPDDIDAWYLLRTVLFPLLFFYFTNLMFAYFGGVMRWQKWKNYIRILAIPVYLTLTIALVFAIWPGNQIGEGGLISCLLADHILFFLGIFLSMFGINTLLLVGKWCKKFDENEFANPEEFPVLFARRMMMFQVVISLLIWANVLFGTPVFTAIVMFVLSVSEIFFLILALPPHRTQEYVEASEEAPHTPETETSNATRQGYLQGLSKEKEAEILYAIQAVVIEQQAYLDPHITLQDIANRCGYSRTYIAGLFKSELGGFFSFINLLRLEHAEAYQHNHPNASIQEVAMESGFSSRQNYYSVKARLTAKTEL